MSVKPHMIVDSLNDNAYFLAPGKTGRLSTSCDIRHNSYGDTYNNNFPLTCFSFILSKLSIWEAIYFKFNPEQQDNLKLY